MDEVAWMYEQDPARMKPIEESHGEFVSPISEELLKEIWEYICLLYTSDAADE